MTGSGFSPSSAAKRLAAIAFGYVLAAVSAGATVWFQMQILGGVLRKLGDGREVAAWALELTRADPGLIGPIIGGLMIIGALPAIVIIGLCERAAIRSPSAYGIAGAVTLPFLALLGAVLTGGLADLGDGGLVMLLALAPLPGFVGGLVYWAVAGHAAGRGWNAARGGTLAP